ncbi:helix-turn-helix domain-containing protein [Kordia jejudonensis]|uniref:helix-turn-helix domain-containing protein n=1 Tax=Kordia jejudonensis TaxID=1348245 RepID=UPI000629AE4F|nr:helix-turn-helix domain-containing protein [Kordia jejudonensis]
MINTSDFTKRLRKILEYYGLSASAFADKLSVQRSSISHILSGRNKPSLEFVMKILNAFPEVELYWLLNGKGSFPKKVVTENVATSTPITTPKIVHEETSKSFPLEESIISKSTAQGKKIDKIVIFYTDGTFEAYQK